MNLSGASDFIGASIWRAKAAAKRSLVTAAIAIVGALIIACAAGFAAGAAYIGLALIMPDYLAALTVAVILLIVGSGVLIWVGGSRDGAPQPKRPQPQPAPQADPATEVFRQAAAAMAHTKDQPASTLLTAVALGVAAGLMTPEKRGEPRADT
ncbi:MAG: phage holin family protein [Rhodospirillales bacterium]|nr:phage holin family protein [Rhodospirillales bacterium]